MYMEIKLFLKLWRANNPEILLASEYMATINSIVLEMSGSFPL